MGYRQRPSPSPSITCVWSAVSDEDGLYPDPANEFWGIAFTRSPDSRLSAELIGPSLKPRMHRYVAGEEHWGVELAAHVFVRNVEKRTVLDLLIPLPVEGEWFELGGARYRIPGYDELEDLVAMLEKQGTLVANHAIARELGGDEAGFSERSRQRHYRHSTGLARKQIEQQRQVRYAFALMHAGMSLAQAAFEAGYADQAHMTRAFRAIAGQSPARILSDHLGDGRAGLLLSPTRQWRFPSRDRDPDRGR